MGGMGRLFCGMCNTETLDACLVCTCVVRLLPTNARVCSFMSVLEIVWADPRVHGSCCLDVAGKAQVCLIVLYFRCYYHSHESNIS